MSYILKGKKRDKREMTDMSIDENVKHPATPSLTFPFEGSLLQSRIF